MINYYKWCVEKKNKYYYGKYAYNTKVMSAIYVQTIVENIGYNYTFKSQFEKYNI